MERIVLGLKQQEILPPQSDEPDILVAHFGGETKRAAVQIVYRLRERGIGARLAFARNRRSMKSQMREGNRYGVRYMLIIGETELEKKEAIVRPMDGGEQVQMAIDDIVEWFVRQ